MTERLTNSAIYNKKIEKEFGIDSITFFKALKKGIWSKEHLTYKNKHCRQTEKYKVMPIYNNNKWELWFNPSSPCGDSEYGKAHIFWDRVAIKDYGITWALTKKELL